MGLESLFHRDSTDKGRQAAGGVESACAAKIRDLSTLSCMSPKTGLHTISSTHFHVTVTFSVFTLKCMNRERESSVSWARADRHLQSGDLRRHGLLCHVLLEQGVRFVQLGLNSVLLPATVHMIVISDVPLSILAKSGDVVSRVERIAALMLQRCDELIRPGYVGPPSTGVDVTVRALRVCNRG